MYLIVPRRHKTTSSSPLFRTGVSAALSSRDTGERRATRGDTGDATPAGVPFKAQTRYCFYQIFQFLVQYIQIQVLLDKSREIKFNAM